MCRKAIIRISLILWMGLFIGCGEKIEPGTNEPASGPAVRVTLTTAEASSQPFVYEALGTVIAQTTSTLSGKIMGTIKAVNVQEGDSVKQGDVLVLIDKRQVTAQLRQAEAVLAEARKAETAAESAHNVAKAGAQLAEATYNRYQRLIREESATRQEFEEVEARYQQARASMAQADAMVAAARSRVEQVKAAVAGSRVTQKDATILAPYDGTVIAKMIEVGDLASPGIPFLSLEKVGVYQVELVLPENHIHAVRIDQKLDVTISALEGLQLSGIVKTIAPTADQKSRSFMIKLVLPENSRLRSGMFARVTIPIGEGGMMLMPRSAAIYQGQLTGFFLVDEKNIARYRLIRIGRVFGDRLEIISGLKPGTRYVTVPPPELKDGTPVEASP